MVKSFFKVKQIKIVPYISPENYIQIFGEFFDKFLNYPF